MKTIKCCNYVITVNKKRISIQEPSGWFCNTGLFYFDRKETQKLHKMNLKNGYSCVNNAYGYYTQLVGMENNILNKKVYTRLINAYIKGEFND